MGFNPFINDKPRENLLKLDNSFEKILIKIKGILKTDTDSDVAEAIGMTASAFNARKMKGSIPYKNFIEFANQRKIDLEWLLKYSDPTKEDELKKHEPHGNITQVIIEHQDIIREFQDQDKAMEFNQFLVEIEKHDPEGYDELYREARAIYKTLKRIQQKEALKKTSDKDNLQNGTA